MIVCEHSSSTILLGWHWQRSFSATFRLPATQDVMINLIKHQIYASWTGKGGKNAE